MIAYHHLEVGMGEVKVGAHHDLLQAVLGSCVGIGFIWKKAGRCGLAHCLLPEAPTPVANLGARYVNQAVPSLLKLMRAKEEDYPDIEVILTGGAQMLKNPSPLFQVGQLNCAAAKKYLTQTGLQVAYCDLGGKCGRKILIDCADQSYSITEILPQRN
ncbi:chemotaxis protein CheD [Undibacterium terreum]|uniref:Chemoreceptor glutamine deamidase CheD 2 n=1 Tax=Undibacterium terreum TaxID=1224302 RepID=A0A916XLP5_9BURK|nr:chemotaxis protein CheD [Undibacterium terreum]GGC84810.1 putative chemoreceptor glutamine deamidase CheD 2 [Undibacterium terreum]